MSENEDGDTPRTLHDVAGGEGVGAEPDENLDKQVDTMRWALEEIRPDLTQNEVPIAERMLQILDGHSSNRVGLATKLGISKGWESKLWHSVVGKMAKKIKGRK
jgi:hypothetical protein